MFFRSEVVCGTVLSAMEDTWILLRNVIIRTKKDFDTCSHTTENKTANAQSWLAQSLWIINLAAYYEITTLLLGLKMVKSLDGGKIGVCLSSDPKSPWRAWRLWFLVACYYETRKFRIAPKTYLEFSSLQKCLLDHLGSCGTECRPWHIFTAQVQIV